MKIMEKHKSFEPYFSWAFKELIALLKSKNLINNKSEMEVESSEYNKNSESDGISLLKSVTELKKSS